MSILIRELFSHPNISTFYLLVNVTCLRTIFDDPLPVCYIKVQYRWAGRNINSISQNTISYKASKDLILVHTEQLKTTIKPHSLGRMLSSGTSDVVITSVHTEKTRPKKLMMIIVIMVMMIIINKSQETKVFSSHQNLTSCMKLSSEK